MGEVQGLPTPDLPAFVHTFMYGVKPSTPEIRPSPQANNNLSCVLTCHGSDSKIYIYKTVVCCLQKNLLKVKLTFGPGILVVKVLIERRQWLGEL
jgi:hypothetical protein